MRPKKRILIVGASEIRNSVLRYMLHINGYAASAVASAAEALAAIRTEQYDLLLCDASLPDIVYLFNQAHAEHDGLPLMAISTRAGKSQETLAADALIQWQDYTSAYLLERIKVLCARKRGPRPVKKLPIPAIPAAVMSDADRRLA